MKKLILISILSVATTAWAAEDPVEAQFEKDMKTLDLPDHAPAALTKEKLYSVQPRYAPLQNRNEISFGGGQNMSGNSFLQTQQIELAYRRHFNDRWAVATSAAWVQNRFTDNARRLQQTDGILPDIQYARERYDVAGEVNLFYGKFRLTRDQVFYFDQYLALGPGLEHLTSTWVGAATGDIGLVVWFGHWGSLRMGVKDYYYNETSQEQTTARNNLHWHIDLGVVL
jgi:outer membrane beta-barrel protein